VKRAAKPEELGEGVMFCRAYGHSWSDPHKKAFGGRGRKRGWAVTLICPVCGTEKHFQLDQRGDLAKPRYRYPDNYLAAFFIGPEERGAFRLQSLGIDPDEGLRMIQGGAA